MAGWEAVVGGFSGVLKGMQPGALGGMAKAPSLRDRMSWVRKIWSRMRQRLGFLFPVSLPSWRRYEHPGLGSGVAMSFRGHDLWVVSPDVPLRESPEAALCLLAPWCAERGRSLLISHSSVDASVVENVRSATDLMGNWWGHPPVHVGHGNGRKDKRITPAPTGMGKVGLFFSGGVDSFYSLFHHPNIHCIVFVVGFDVPVAKQEIWQAMVESFRAVATARGVEFILVATNLRAHPRLRLKWERHHGAALAVIGHLLGERATTWVISSTYHRNNLRPWGSHPELDHRWGGDAIHFVHFGTDLWRAEKLACLTDQSVVHRWLRVCYHDPKSEGNCGYCMKCVVTRLVYWQELPGIHCATMPSIPQLDTAIDALPGVHSMAVYRVFSRFLERSQGEGPIEQALQRLLIRSSAYRPG